MASSWKKKTGIALVAEGGGMRGIFCAGVLDVFMERQFKPFDLYIGASAGACNLASFLAGQHERNLRIYTRLMTRPEFISLKKFISGSHMMDLDYLWSTIDVKDPLEVDELYQDTNRDFIIVGSSVETGRPVYLQPGSDDCSESLKSFR